MCEHHEVFHDGINYYAFALAAMAEGMLERDASGKVLKDDDGKEKRTAMGQFAEQVLGKRKPKAGSDSGEMEWEGGRWDDFTHKGTRRPGLKHSLARTLGFDPKTVTREQCIERILGDALKKFPNRMDAEGHDVFHGVISELFPAKSRGAPKKLANEDPGWLCWKNKGGEPPAEKTYRNQQGIYDFMAELFSADAASLKKLAGKSVLETCLSGVTKAKASDDDEDSENEDVADPDEAEGETDEADEAVKCFEGTHAINQLRKCVRSAKTLLLDSDFKRDFELLGAGRFNARSELARLLKSVRRLKPSVLESPESLKFQEWKRNGDGKDNERVELFVLLHFAGKHHPGGIEFAGAMLMTRLKRRLLGNFRKNLPQQYLDFVQRFDLVGPATEGKESPKQIETAKRAAEKQARGETKPLAKNTDFIPRIRKALGYVFPSFTAIRGFIAQTSDPAKANEACKHGHLGWSKFDNSAYEEAIKSPHQIREKQKERENERAKLETLKKLYEGKGREKGKDDEGEDEDFIPGGFTKSGGDPRFAAMERIHEDMAIADGTKEGEFHKYGISQAALRGYEELLETWNKVVVDPQLWSIHSRLRSERKFGDPSKPKAKKVRGKGKPPEAEQPVAEAIKPDTFWVSEKEKRKYGEPADDKRIQIKLLDAEKANLKASDSRHPNFFNDVADMKTWIHDGAASLEGLPSGSSKPVHLVSSKALWGYVKTQAWKRCMAINAARVKAWGIEPPAEWKA